MRYTTGSVLVKLAGVGDRDGIYRFSDGATLGDVKNMTNLRGVAKSKHRHLDTRRLKNGDMVVFNRLSSNQVEIIVKNMNVTELILLGIPLDPDSMSADDWEALPGIGPSLARVIVSNRQKYGDFGGLEGILRVPGIGYGKINAVRRFF
ncbi:MAG TPA: helix-hairpin-helix domain-containing protein [Geobacteraceae bacterium]|nr:helix-hairpin-helix domain-containing protein [Geobacteraceae bacterium]